jgi:hypothetical protein
VVDVEIILAGVPLRWEGRTYLFDVDLLMEGLLQIGSCVGLVDTIHDGNQKLDGQPSNKAGRVDFGRTSHGAFHSAAQRKHVL